MSDPPQTRLGRVGLYVGALVVAPAMFGVGTYAKATSNGSSNASALREAIVCGGVLLVAGGYIVWKAMRSQRDASDSH